MFFIDVFLSFGAAKAVGKALERLVEKNEISRVSRGIYSRLKQLPLLGELSPATEAIAIAIAKKDKGRIIPTGVLALNALGLSTQVPLKIVYLTDGSARTIKIGKRTIKFKKVSPKNLAAIGPVSSLVIQALKIIGKDNANEKEIQISLKVNLPAYAVKKDWWVVQTLALLLEMEIGKHMVFKGGTSLSKAWGLIDRFSEDIDLAVDLKFYDFDGEFGKE